KDLYLDNAPTLYDVFTEKKAIRTAPLIHQHPREPYAVIPSHYQMMLAEQTLFMARNREHKLKALLDGVADQFDWILIDCPPALGNLTDNALNAARQVIIPIEAEPSSLRAIDLLLTKSSRLS